MGSSIKRKSNDQVRINPPRVTSATSGNQGVGSGGSAPVDTNNLCPVSFHVKLKQQGLPAGLPLEINEKTIELSAGKSVGEITTNTYKRMEACAGMGITYSAKTAIDKKGISYAEFTQA